MLRKTVLLAAAATLATLALAAPAQAAVVTSISGGTTYTFGTASLFTAGPQTVAPGITWTSTTTSSVYGYTSTYGLGGNGAWDGTAFSYIGLNESSGTMTVAFTNPVTSVGSFLNYAPGTGIASISVYDASHSLIESLNLSISTPGATDGGAFFGFSESTADISYLTYNDAYIVASNLVVNGVSSVPEPVTLSLFGAGLVGAAAFARKKKS